MRTMAMVAALALGACNADPDGDGLGNKDERYWTTDPKVADSDGDGLPDGQEVEIGSHPAYADTDGDGTNDGDEVALGLDPLDANSRPYLGGWPIHPQADKDAMEATNVAADGIEVGERFKRFFMVDQFGDRVDLYDFAAAGVPIVIDVSAEWCGPCNALAEWFDLQEGDGGYDNPFNGMPPDVRDAVNNGDLIWITVLGESNEGEATPRTAKSWYREYKNPNIPVFADAAYHRDSPRKSLVTYVDLPYWPVTMLLDENLVVTAYDDYGAITDAAVR